MNFRGLIPLINLIFSKVFVKALFWFFVLILLASVLPWTKTVYDEIFPQAELRITQFTQEQDGQIEDDWLDYRIAVVENRGNVAAETVYVTASLPGGEIFKYEVFADYPYTVHSNTDLSRGYLVLAFDRLPPRARVKLYLREYEIHKIQGELSFSAVHDQGAAPKTNGLSSEEQIRNFVNSILDNLEKSFAMVIDEVFGPEGTEGQELTLGNVSIQLDEIPRHLLISTVTLAFLAWLFLEPIQYALVHGILAYGLIWLIIPPIIIPAWVMFLCTVPFLVIVISRRYISGQSSPRQRDEWVISLSALFLCFVIVDTLGIWRLTRDITDCVTVGYVIAMLSLQVL